MSAFLRKRKERTVSTETTDTTVEVTPDTTEVESRASTIVIASFEREAAEARNMADLDEIQAVQDRYHDARIQRAQRQIDREGESK